MKPIELARIFNTKSDAARHGTSPAVMATSNTNKEDEMKKTTSWLVMLAATLVAGLVSAAEPAAAPAAWPLWDGKESVADYAKRAGIKDVEMTLDLGGGVSMKMTLIPAGKYLRGLRGEEVEIIEGIRVMVRERDNGWMPDKGPQSEVTLTKPFYMSIYEVTQEQFEQITGKNPSRYKEGKTHPVNNIMNNQTRGLPIDTFCEKVSAKTGLKVSLPTEAQWEHACLAGTKTRYYWGDDPAEVSKYENFKVPNDGFETTAPVGSFKPNPWGLYDMLGNVSEWVSDLVTPSYLGAPTVDPAGPGYAFPLAWNPDGCTLQSLYKWGCFDHPGTYPAYACFGSGHTGHGIAPSGIDHMGFRIVAALKPTGTPAQEAKAKNPPKAASTAASVPATAGPADPKVRVPPGCRAAAGTLAEPYTKSGWAQAIVHEATGMEMVYVPAGSFIRGFNLREPTKEEQDIVTYLTLQIGGWGGPHRVTLTKGFYMGKTEVTQAQWEKMMGKNPAHFKNAGPEAPVEMVSWNDCQEFCQKAGGGLRLPTEAEWEYACRAGTKGLYAGDPEAMGWYLGNSDGATHPVGMKKPNAWGLYDMHGNVWEWCQDWFADYEGPDDKTDPAGPTKETGMRVIRGGGWGDYGTHCMSGIRDSYLVRGKPAPAFFAVGCRFVIPAAVAP